VGTTYGSPALKLNGRALACVPINKSAEPNSAAFFIDIDQRTTLIAAKPEIYYVTDHYEPHPTVLVRLSRIKREEIGKLFELALDHVAKKKPVPQKSRR